MPKLKDKLCSICKERKAISCRKHTGLSRNKMYFAYREDHDLCKQCWESIKDSTRMGSTR